MANEANGAAAIDLDFDPAALKAKYQAERAKRLRKEGNEQYVEIKGEFAHYLEDPYVPAICHTDLRVSARCLER